MNDEQARTLATRIIDTWPNGPKGYIWQNELKPLDSEHAAEAFRLLRQETDRATTAQFHAKYRAVRGANSVLVTPVSCQPCQGTGWVEASSIEAHNPRVCNAAAGDPGCSCHAVKPCRCSNAHQAHVIVDLIHGERARHQGAA